MLDSGDVRGTIFLQPADCRLVKTVRCPPVSLSRRGYLPPSLPLCYLWNAGQSSDSGDFHERLGNKKQGSLSFLSVWDIYIHHVLANISDPGRDSQIDANLWTSNIAGQN